MSKFIQIYFFHHSTFPLPTKQKGEKIKSLLSSHNFLSSHFSTPPTKRTLKEFNESKMCGNIKGKREIHLSQR